MNIKGETLYMVSPFSCNKMRLKVGGLNMTQMTLELHDVVYVAKGQLSLFD